MSLKEISNEFNIEIGNDKKSAENNDSASSTEERTATAEQLSTDSGGAKREKATKAVAVATRMKHIKKSMLNDNKLEKLRQKFLKRSKSVTELSINYSDELKAATTTTAAAAGTKDNFKENLNPEQSPSPKPLNNSCNRNKVKMGTRVFSQQFLNRSCDNIFDNAFNIARDGGALQNSHSFCSSVGGGLETSIVGGALHDLSFDPIDEMDSEGEEGRVICNPDGPKFPDLRGHRGTAAAYVLHESIHSSLPDRTDHYSVVPEEETISESLLEKFNDLSSTGMEDRVIRTVDIRKDAVVLEKTEDAEKPTQRSAFERFKMLSANRFSKRFLRGKKSKALEVRDEDEGGAEKKFSLGISIVQGSDGNIYVKDLAPNGAGDRHGIRMGDQVGEEIK